MIYRQPNADAVRKLEDELIQLLPEPPVFDEAAIDNLTYDAAMEVIRATRRMLITQLMYQEYHEHMLDDCGDYLEAATYNWNRLHDVYFTNDGDEAIVIAEVRKFLCLHADYPLGGCDGEIRYNLLSEELFDKLYPNQEVS